MVLRLLMRFLKGCFALVRYCTGFEEPQDGILQLNMMRMLMLMLLLLLMMMMLMMLLLTLL